MGNANAHLLVYSTSGITSVEKVCRELKMAAILKILKYQTQLQFDLRYEKVVPNYAMKSIFHDDDVTDDVTGWLKVGPLYSFINEITTCFMITKIRAKISSLNFLYIGIRRLWLHLYKHVFMTSLMKCVATWKWRPFWKSWNIKHSCNITSVINTPSQIMPKNYTCQTKISMSNIFRDSRSKVNVIGLLGDIISNTITVEMVTTSIMSRCDFENSQISAKTNCWRRGWWYNVPHSS